MIFGTMLIPSALAQQMQEPLSNLIISKSLSQSTKINSSQDTRHSIEKSVNTGIELLKVGQIHQSRIEFVGALKQVYPAGVDYLTMSDKKSMTILLGENNNAKVYAELFPDARKNSFEILWK
jgi:hypothetical protein